METLENKIRQNIVTFFESWNTHDRKRSNSLSALIDKKFIRIDNGKIIANNREEYLTWASAHPHAFSDAKVTINETSILDNKAYLHWTFTGTNNGPLGDIPATQLKVKNTGFSIWTYNDHGLAIKEEAFYNELSLMQQLGF
ncbi:MAG: ester cyclase, partial [Chitinophagales bacterium]